MMRDLEGSRNQSFDFSNMTLNGWTKMFSSAMRIGLNWDNFMIEQMRRIEKKKKFAGEEGQQPLDSEIEGIGGAEHFGYDEERDSSGIPRIMVHGLAEKPEYWNDFANKLVEKDDELEASYWAPNLGDRSLEIDDLNEIAYNLSDYINDVRDYTGQEEVQLIGISQGAYAIAKYLDLIEPGFVDRSVLMAGFFGGSPWHNFPAGDRRLAEGSDIRSDFDEIDELCEIYTIAGEKDPYYAGNIESPFLPSAENYLISDKRHNSLRDEEVAGFVYDLLNEDSHI